MLGVLALAARADDRGGALQERRQRQAGRARRASRPRPPRPSRSPTSLNAYTDFAALRVKRDETVKQIADSRFDWAHALSEVARTVPKDAWLVSLDGTVKPTPPAPAEAYAPRCRSRPS